MNDEIVGVRPSKAAWREVSRAVEKVNGQVNSNPQRQTTRVSAPAIWVAWAKVSEEVGDGNYDSPGRGKAELESSEQEVDVINRLGGGVIEEDTGVLLLWTAMGWQVLAACPS